MSVSHKLSEFQARLVQRTGQVRRPSPRMRSVCIGGAGISWLDIVLLALVFAVGGWLIRTSHYWAATALFVLAMAGSVLSVAW